MWMIFGVSRVSPIFASKLNIELNFSYGLGMGTSVLYSKHQKTVVRVVDTGLCDGFSTKIDSFK